MAVAVPRLIGSVARPTGRLVVALVVAAVCAGCPSKTPLPPATSPDPESPIEKAAELPADESGPAEADRPTCDPPARVWDGRAEGCLYEVEGCCYDAPSTACRAASCTDDCQIIEVRPAQITCPP